MNWFGEQRIAWIRDVVDVYGFVNRRHIVRKFGVSVPQASLDLREAQTRYPDELYYNGSSKRYERKTGVKPATKLSKGPNCHV